MSWRLRFLTLALLALLGVVAAAALFRGSQQFEESPFVRVGEFTVRAGFSMNASLTLLFETPSAVCIRVDSESDHHSVYLVSRDGTDCQMMMTGLKDHSVWSRDKFLSLMPRVPFPSSLAEAPNSLFTFPSSEQLARYWDTDDLVGFVQVRVRFDAEYSFPWPHGKASFGARGSTNYYTDKWWVAYSERRNEAVLIDRKTMATRVISLPNPIGQNRLFVSDDLIVSYGMRSSSSTEKQGWRTSIHYCLIEGFDSERPNWRTIPVETLPADVRNFPDYSVFPVGHRLAVSAPRHVDAYEEPIYVSSVPSVVFDVDPVDGTVLASRQYAGEVLPVATSDGWTLGEIRTSSTRRSVTSNLTILGESAGMEIGGAEVFEGDYTGEYPQTLRLATLIAAGSSERLFSEWTPDHSILRRTVNGRTSRSVIPFSEGSDWHLQVAGRHIYLLHWHREGENILCEIRRYKGEDNWVSPWYHIK